MEREMTFDEALSRCQMLAARSECCSSDMMLKMQRWQVPADIRQRVLKQLIDEKFIDDNRYAISFVRDKTRFNHWGRIKTTLMLRQKKIAPAAIDNAFAELPKTDYQKALTYESDKKLKQLRTLQPFERRQKTAAYLIQKGFEPDLVFKNLDQ
mgnify:CR=1 FL=1